MGFHARGNTTGARAEKMGSRSTESFRSPSVQNRKFVKCVSLLSVNEMCVKFRVRSVCVLIKCVCVEVGVQDGYQSWIN